MQVAPGLSKPPESAALKRQCEGEARRDMEASAGFSGRVQEWQQEYCRDALSHQPEGAVRLTVVGEDGLQRPCCAFVKPLQLGRSAVPDLHHINRHLSCCLRTGALYQWEPTLCCRSLSTPREAARFVSLLSMKQAGGEAADMWSSLHTILEACQASQV